MDEQSLNPGSEYFLYVGGYDQRKGLEQLLRVFNELVRTKESTAGLILVGMARPLSGEFQNLLKLGLDSGRVRQTGYVDDNTLRQLLRHAIALVFPSRYEGFGLPALEAMASGCPVITTRSTSLPEVCGDAACYFDHLDDRSLAGAMQRIEQSSELRQQFSQMGRVRSQRFCWETSAGKFLQAIETLARRSTA